MGATAPFFAATIVVRNASEVSRAEQLARDTFDVQARRPPDPAKTKKAPEAFPFDDLRLYLKLRPDPALPPSDLVGIVFELQIKTFLQHAWGIATHDLIYKTDGVSWSKERIAYQTKAMLEHAEISIQEAERLALTPSLALEHERSADLQKFIALLKAQWDAAELPTDVKRLAQNVAQIANALNLQHDRLAAVLAAGKDANGGAHPANLSPYATVVSYLLAQEAAAMRGALAAGSKLRVLIPGEIDLPGGLTRADLPRAIFVD